MRKLALAAATAAVVGLFAGTVGAADPNFPSAKHAAMVGNIHVVRELGPIGPNASDQLHDMGSILTTKIKTGNQKALSIIVSLECGNITETLVRSKGGKSDKSTAGASVRVAVLVDGVFALPTGDNTRVFPSVFGTVPMSQQGVIFCKQTQELEAKFQGIINVPTGGTLGECLEDVINSLNRDEWIAEDPLGLGGDLDDAELGQVFDAIIAGDTLANINTLIEGFGGTAITQAQLDSQETSQQIKDDCLLPEEVRLLLDSMQASTFVFIAPVGSGTHHVSVKSWVDLGAEAQEGEASAAATIGLGTVLVEEIRLVRGFGIECDNTTYGTPACGDDADGDGIADIADPCPAIPGVMISTDLDSDDDGTIDSEDGEICTAPS